MLVGRVGVEPTTSRLSGVRSNHLSYRPVPAAPSVAAKLRLMARFAALAGPVCVQNSLRYFVSQTAFLMKGHEDGGLMCIGHGGSSSAVCDAKGMGHEALSAAFLRKEVIQPQVPLRLPCYDFTPVAKPTVVACLSCELAQRLRVNPTPMV